MPSIKLGDMPISFTDEHTYLRSDFLKCPLCLRIFFENSVGVINMNCTEN